ncbi:RES family NAD+ phosphorylase [Vibrio hepatarius]|uniref:RES family NAD+ phosphorylase n=1 Tax=Vibrio hepatarius TaxID=171383 RepID=UPI001C092C52|nr:RES family NAD+ phosphorylase [Vibrio hepatarius]MBU2898035.1 RES family NAD+ phosphorylase [Vibrio hepatarius]
MYEYLNYAEKVEANRKQKEMDNSVGFICSDCKKRIYKFDRKNKPVNQKQTCIICKKHSPDGVPLEGYVFRLNDCIPNHFNRVDKDSEASLSLHQIIKKFTIDNECVARKLAELLHKENSEFFHPDGLYEPYLDERTMEEFKNIAQEEWNKFSKELKYSRRFTHQKAADFFMGLINCCYFDLKKKVNGTNDFGAVTRSIEKGTVLYRARIVCSDEEKNEFQSAPNKHLGAPPSHLAANNRMSPPGISFMYTADTADTAIAELRPYVGDTIAVGRFIAQKTLTFFDFTNLDSLELREPRLITNPRNSQYYINSHLLSTLHALVSKPFRANSIDYIETQMFSETIRNYQKGIFDGIIFKSSQLEGGVNYVIFGNDSKDEHHSIEYNVKIDTQSDVTFYKVNAMTPSFKEVTSANKHL